MTFQQAVAAVVAVLRDLDIPYVLVGAFSSNAYGIPRSTQDADFVALLGARDVATIADRLGPGFRLDPQISFESATGTTRYVVHFADSSGVPFHIEFFELSDDEFDRQRFARRQEALVLEQQAYLLTAEDTVVTKLRWFQALRRAKDREDARGVIAVQGDRLDWAYIHRWSDAHGTRDLLDEIRRSIA